MLEGKKILIAGPTGMVALPITLALAEANEVWGAARFSDVDARSRLEAAGVRCVKVDLARGDLGALPDDFSHLLNFAVTKSNKWTLDMDANAGGIGALMAHCRGADSVLHCSSTGVYRPNGHHAFAEDDALGDSHAPILPTYSITKIAAEAVARFCARQFNLPTTIARLNVPYGDDGGWPLFTFEIMRSGAPVPVHADSPSVYNPIHHDDMLAMIPRLLDVASVPATIVNWAGDESVSVEEWCSYMGELTGTPARFETSELALPSVKVDVTRMHELIGPATVGWREGFARMVRAQHPELVSSTL